MLQLFISLTAFSIFVLTVLISATMIIGTSHPSVIIVAYTYYLPDQTNYFLSIDTERNLFFRIESPVEVWRQPIYSPNGQWVILRTDTDGSGKEYRGYHLFERRLLDIVPDHGICRASFHSDDMIQFSPDGESALLLCAPLQSGEEGANLYLIHSVTEQVIPILGRRVVDVRWSPDGSQWLLSVGRQLEIYDTDDLSLIQSVSYDSSSSGFEWSPDGTHIAYTVFGVGLILYDVVNGTENVIAIERIGGPQWSPDRYVSRILKQLGEKD